ncbi:hypothetical protein [Halorientalis pallida]|uniref:Methyltransferase domain-containing protein n=1 Tax=Halorientalis pallida TaxID=2479928 RepID=A0A498KZ49_9EURY|nr:hypothetical protein [Halorientalis pallida]RXK50568.1 hypothetical protein EAF64_08455 [Halorientalis pallida]
MTADDFQQYLAAKRSVDDRSLDRRLWRQLRTNLATAGDDEGPFRVLEVGAGVGTMIERAVEWDLFPGDRDVVYTAVDQASDNTAAIPDRLAAWAADRPVDVSERDDGIDLVCPERTVAVRPVTAEAEAFVADTDRSWDLLLGLAVLDVIGLETLPTLLSGLAPEGCWYFPITFDGGTRFTPAHPADDAVERAYHGHMDAKPGGDSRAGHHALARLRELDGATVSGVAGSDWVVYPDAGGYPGDEASFLRYVLETVEGALGEVDRGEALDDGTLDDWLRTRREQVASGDLVYVTHQLDLLGQWTGGE